MARKGRRRAPPCGSPLVREAARALTATGENRFMDTLIHNNLRAMYHGLFDSEMALRFVREHPFFKPRRILDTHAAALHRGKRPALPQRPRQ